MNGLNSCCSFVVKASGNLFLSFFIFIFAERKNEILSNLNLL